MKDVWEPRSYLGVVEHPSGGGLEDSDDDFFDMLPYSQAQDTRSWYNGNAFPSFNDEPRMVSESTIANPADNQAQDTFVHRKRKGGSFLDAVDVDYPVAIGKSQKKKIKVEEHQMQNEPISILSSDEEAEIEDLEKK
jgi:hypothetical protein